MVESYLRYRDLEKRKIVLNRVTLGRWIAAGIFPPGFMIGPNSRVWPESEIEAYLEKRKAESRLSRRQNSPAPLEDETEADDAIPFNGDPADETEIPFG